MCECVRAGVLGYEFVRCLFGFYGILTFVGYLMPNQCLYKYPVLSQTVLLSMSTQLNCQKHFYFKLLSLVKQFFLKQLSLV